MTDKHSAKQNLTLTEPRHINLLYIQVLLTVEVVIAVVKQGLRLGTALRERRNDYDLGIISYEIASVITAPYVHQPYTYYTPTLFQSTKPYTTTAKRSILDLPIPDYYSFRTRSTREPA